MTTFTSREFNQDLSGAKKAATQGPVTVTDRGKPAFVLLSIADYRRLANSDSDDFLERMKLHDDIDVDFPPMSFASTDISPELASG